MPNIVFTKGGDTFTFSKGASYPGRRPAAVNVPVDYSEGGQLYAYDKGIAEQFFELNFEGLSQTDYDNVENWLLNVAVGPLNTFTFTDEDGTDHTVRLMNVKNPLSETAAGLFAGTIELRAEL